MSKINDDKLSAFESELENIRFAAPSEDYVRRGKEIINQQRRIASGEPGARTLFSFPFAFNTKTVFASALLVLGIIISLVVQGDVNFFNSVKGIDSIAYQFRKSAAHDQFQEISELVTRRSFNASNYDPIFDVAMTNYLVASCDSCHEQSSLIQIANQSLSANSVDVSALIKL